MATSLGKDEAPTEHVSGVGQIRERTIVVGDTLIVIDKIASIRILEVRPGRLLAGLGVLASGVGVGAMILPNTLYGSAGPGGSSLQLGGMILIGIGLAIIVGNLLLPVRRGIGIGANDGRTCYVVSKDRIFLDRLLEVLARKINTGSESLTASFDITHRTLREDVDRRVVTTGRAASDSEAKVPDFVSVTTTADNAMTALHLVAAAPPATVSEPTEITDPDETLFAEDPSPLRLSPEPQAEALTSANTDVVAPTSASDSRLDRPETSHRDIENREWLTQPGRITYGSVPEDKGARWLLAMVLLLLAGGGGFAGWYFYRQSQIQPVESPLAASAGVVAQAGQ